MRGALAAGHPLTAATGADVLRAGGNAVDACIAAAAVSWICESPLTGLGGGGFLLVHLAGDAKPHLLDFFVAVPQQPVSPDELLGLVVDFGDSQQVFYTGPASVAVPGTGLGLWEAHRRWASVPWAELLAPATRLARDGVVLDEPQAYLHEILDSALGRPFPRMAQQRVEDLVEIRPRLVEDDAVAGKAGRRSEQLRPRHRSPAAMSLPQPESRPRHGDRGRAGVEDLLRVAEVDDELEQLIRRGRPLRHRHEEVEEVRSGVAREVNEEEASATQARERALADPGDGRRRDARVHRVAACAQDIGSRLGGERMAGC